MNVLQVLANPKPTEESVSKQLATEFFMKLIELVPDVEVENVDLYNRKPPYLSYDAYRCFYNPVQIDGYQPTDKETTAGHFASTQGELFNNADVVLISTPMWNYSVPAVLKAWIDQLMAPGVAFEMLPEGPRPLHHVARIVLLVASGGVYKEDDPYDCLSRLIRASFGFIGITDVEIAWADGQNANVFHDSEERRQLAIEAAQEIAEDIAEMA